MAQGLGGSSFCRTCSGPQVCVQSRLSTRAAPKAQRLTGPLMVPEASRSPGRRLQPLTVWWVSCWSIVQYMCCGQGHRDREVAHPSLLVGSCTVTHDRRPPLGSLPVPQPAHPGHSQQPRAVLPGSPLPSIQAVLWPQLPCSLRHPQPVFSKKADLLPAQMFSLQPAHLPAAL